MQGKGTILRAAVLACLAAACPAAEPGSPEGAEREADAPPAAGTFTFSVVPESEPVVLDPEGRVAVLEKTVPSGPRRIACLFRLATGGLLPEEGPQAWSISVRHDPGLTVASGIDAANCPTLLEDPFSGVRVATIFDHDGKSSTPDLDPYELDLGASAFATARPATLAGCSGLPDDSAPGIISAVVLHFTRKMVLRPNAVSTILRFSYDVDVLPGRNPDLKVWFEDGLSVPRCSCGAVNALTVGSATVYPTGAEGLVLRFTGTVPGPSAFIRGDANADGAADLSDAIAILGFLFLHDPPVLPCRESADADDSGRLDISDGISLLNFLFLGRPPPPQPFPACGDDGATPDDLGCETFAPCA